MYLISIVEDERGKASPNAVIRIANILGVPVDELLNGDQMYNCNTTENQTDIFVLSGPY